jgi:hypothetical protein
MVATVLAQSLPKASVSAALLHSEKSGKRTIAQGEFIEARYYGAPGLDHVGNPVARAQAESGPHGRRDRCSSVFCQPADYHSTKATT